MNMAKRIWGVLAICMVLCLPPACSRNPKPVAEPAPQGVSSPATTPRIAAERKKITFTVGEVAELLKCDRGIVLTAIKEGKLKAAKIGKEYRISRADLEEFWLAHGGGKLF
jgi:excisionase family DNA binding protein